MPVLPALLACCALLLCVGCANTAVINAEPLLSSVPLSDSVALPLHQAFARQLLGQIQPGDSRYQHNSDIRGLHSGAPIIYTDCSGFVTLVLEQSAEGRAALARVPKRTPRSRHPLAEHFYASFTNGTFMRVPTVAALRPGDLVAWRYRDPARHDNTGHVLLVDSQPELIDPDGLAAGLQQWAFWVIDASQGPHSAGDTRSAQPAVGLPKRDGVGRGKMRLFTDQAGTVKGYAYFTSKAKFHGEAELEIALARLPS